MSESLTLTPAAVGARHAASSRRRSLGVRLALVWEVVTGGLIELWAHKLRSLLTLTLLMLGVFALVVMTSVLDGVKDKVATGFAGMSWDGTLVLVPRQPKTSEEQKRFAMSTGLRYEDLARIAAPHPQVLGFSPRATKRSVVRVAAGAERIFVTGVTSEYSFLMDRPVGLGRGITENDQRRHSTVAVVGATLASKLFGGSDPVGRDLVIEGVPYRIVGVLAGGQIFNDELWMDANGVLIPLETYMDRMDTAHLLTQVAVKLKSKRDLDEVSASVLARARQAHHGIEDVEAKDLDAELARAYEDFQSQMHGWSVVLFSLAGTVLLVGGVGVLSVMLISFSDRRYEIGLRKAIGADDGQILVQFLLEAVVLAAIGASIGTVAGSALCRALSDKFPWGLVVNPYGLAAAWGIALVLAVTFGLYPAIRAARLSPMEAMR
ncbi:MAG TPA: ABC transporter permease [Thermoanaerobaculia bacterium]|jgi:putative ABC transport system permease protein|nr:ABC transporter permease [Thermoanaerobaculia bacterium]